MALTNGDVVEPITISAPDHIPALSMSPSAKAARLVSIICQHVEEELLTQPLEYDGIKDYNLNALVIYALNKNPQLGFHDWHKLRENGVAANGTILSELWIWPEDMWFGPLEEVREFLDPYLEKKQEEEATISATGAVEHDHPSFEQFAQHLYEYA